ncbi:sugar-transfer associated ATP-grasp domain-containing protein [Flavimarina sp. Hel_I_48]|uniref:sugar-transfer associated ATP-grasp domain-containing protein n=1 Tax=Flavimarina sp. Hel_I_48 TaxID=1392488 RepID=UPI000690DD01|nr:sugar-transfer associated ATP-grasp domain-containing protein [Flavimarina sp. Hel_I_48]
MKFFLARFNQIREDNNPKKSWSKIIKEVITLSIQNKRIPTYYVKTFMYLESSGNYKDFLTLDEIIAINSSPKLHRLEYTTLLKNKLASALYFEKCGLSIPEMPSYNVEKLFFHKSKFERLETTADLIQFFRKVMQESQKDSLFLKDHGAHGGADCFLLKLGDLEAKLEEIEPILLNGSFIHQETVLQHAELNKIYGHSLNTMRFETYIDRDNKKHIRTCYIRFGANGSVIDNSSAGGIGVPVNIETGQLYEKGFKRASGLNMANIYLEHPNSEHPFEGFIIPHFEAAKQLVFDCMKFVPDRYIGWDVAIAANGPVLIEGNGSPRLRESPHGFKSSAIGREILNEIYSK